METMNDGSIFLGKAYLYPVSGQVCITTFEPDEDHNCDEMGCASIGGHIVAWLQSNKTNVRSLPMLGDVASKEIAGIEQWRWNEPIPKLFDVLAVLRSKNGTIVWSKVSSIFPIDDNWTVVCWTFVNPNVVIESGATKAAM